MRKYFVMLLGGLLCFSAAASAEEVRSELSCADFVPTEEGLARFPNLEGACEGVVERDGELFGLFRAIVRAPGNRTTVLYIPATDKTVRFSPEPGTHVIINGEKLRPINLTRGQEIRIYLSLAEFAKPNIEEVVLVTESNVLIEHEVETVAALPTTASLLPALGLGSLVLVGAGWLIRRRRVAVEVEA